MMDFRYLRYFVTVAEEGHLTRAAARLGIQQPPLSQAIRALEADLNVALFRRVARGMELTEAGGALLQDARVILAQIEEARARVERTASGEQGTVSIGFTSSALFHPFVPRIIRKFREERPLVTLRLQEHGNADLVAGLRAERLDAAFIRSRGPHLHGLVVHDVLQEPMLAALPNDHRLAAPANAGHDEPLALAALASEPFVFYRRPQAPGFYTAIIAACRQAGFAPRIVQEAPRVVSTLNLVAAGQGVTVVPESLRQLHMPGLVYRPLEERPALIAPLDLACRPSDRSSAVQQFVAMVRGAARALAKDQGADADMDADLVSSAPRGSS